MSIAVEMSALVDELVAAGIPATADPGQILAVLSGNGVAALVGPPDTALTYLAGSEVQASVPVHLAGNPPGGWAQWLPVWDRLPAAMRVCASTARPVTLQVGDLALPAMRLTAERTFTVTTRSLGG